MSRDKETVSVSIERVGLCGEVNHDDIEVAVVVEQTHAAGHALGQIEPLVVPDVGLEINSACQCDFLRTTTLLVKSQPSRRFEVLLFGSTKQRHTNAGEQHGDFDWFGSVMFRNHARIR